MAQIDLIQDLCVSGSTETPEPFTETSATATLQNNQKLNITINSYAVEFLQHRRSDGQPGDYPDGSWQEMQQPHGAFLRSRFRLLRRSPAPAPAGLAPGTIQFSALADFTTKAFLVPDIGNTVDVVVTFFGSDGAGNWSTTQGTLAATLEDFNNCAPAC